MEHELKRIILVAAAAAVAGLTAACGHTAISQSAIGHTSKPTAAPPSHRSVRPSASCNRQYDTWKHGQGKGLMTALDAVISAQAAGDTRALTTTLKKSRSAVSRGASHPVPACADPRGYWNVLLMHVNAAAATKASPSSVRAAMKGVPKIQRQLTSELKQTAR